MTQEVRMRAWVSAAGTAAWLLIAAVAGAQAPAPASGQDAAALPPLAKQVWDTETAFAKTMADRDHAGFASFLAGESVFMGQTRTFRGKAQVADGWRRYYEGKDAPFSWRPDRVEVLDSGTLASSSGPVFDPTGTRVGTFNSIWRLEADGRWRIIFDSGCPPCDCK
jgi:ketosteroid isomerase-like protein